MTFAVSAVIPNDCRTLEKTAGNVCPEKGSQTEGNRLKMLLVFGVSRNRYSFRLTGTTSFDEPFNSAHDAMSRGEYEMLS